MSLLQRNWSILLGSQVTSCGNAMVSASVASYSTMKGTTPRYMWLMVIAGGATARK